MLTKKHIPLILLTGVALNMPACNCYDGEGEPASIIDQPEALSIIVSGEVIDAATDTPIGEDTDATTTLSIYQAGTLSTQTETALGEQQNQFTLEDGIFSFAVADDTQLPLSLNLVAESAGFFSGGKSLTIDATGTYEIDIRLVSNSDLSQTLGGIEQAQTSIGSNVSSEGRTLSDIAIETASTDNSDGGSVNLDIPAGVNLLTAQGEPVTGDVSVDVAYFSNDIDASTTEASALESFPGGLEADIIVNGEAVEGVFISGGFAAIEISDNEGNNVSQLDAEGEAVSATISIPADTVNPLTDLPVQEGDTIPVWSYDSTTGEWSAEGDGQLGALDIATNTYPVTFDIAHLSYYNLDWRYDGNRICSSTNTLVIVDEDGFPIIFPVAVVIKAINTGYRKKRIVSFNINAPGELAFRQAPSTAVLMDVLFNGVSIADGTEADGLILIDDLCDFPDNLEVPVVAPDALFVDVEVNVIHRCRNNPSITTGVPSTSIRYSTRTGVRQRGWVYTDSSGRAIIPSLLEGPTYRLRVTDRSAGRSTRNQDITTPTDPVTIAFDVDCQTPTGATGATGALGGGE